jgi:peptidoglycan/xylan/chitin deacetylase (PgdA/CDA1 family)
MFSQINLNGIEFPEKTLCLTFDDGPGETKGIGPGPKTLKIAEYLNQNGISATFFMLGKHIVRYPHILPEVAKLGHIVGNHAFCHHVNFPTLLQNRWDFISEIAWTDDLIRPFNPSNDIYFRAPWGQFSPEVATSLNAALSNDLNHVGPFHWDIGGGDWSIWENGGTSQQCAQYLLSDIGTKNHGIVLIHDSTGDLLNAKNNNLAFETLQIIIPQLKEQGYTFINLNETNAPEIAKQ